MAHKDFVLSKIESLLKLLEDTYADSSDFLLPPDYLEVSDILATARKNNTLSSEYLLRLNYIHRKTIAYKDKKMTYEEFIKWRLNDILVHTKDPKKTAMYYILSNFLHDNGTSYTNEEAKQLLEDHLKSLNSQ